METDYRPDAVAKRWTLMLEENDGFGRTPRRFEWKLLNGKHNLGDNKNGASSSCPLKLKKMVIDLANLNIF